GDKGRDTEVLRRAEHAASALSALGAQTAVLDGGRAAAMLTCASDPYTPADVTWARALPDAAITGPGD
ncbi:MAG: PrgI family protein, partial [Micromonospora sp.]